MQCFCLYFLGIRCLLHDQGNRKPTRSTDQYACHLQRRMADHFLQMHVLQERGVVFSLTSIHWAIIWFSTLACSPVSCRTPMASCMVMMATTQPLQKWQSDPRAPSGGNDHGADGRAVGAGHTAVAPHPFQLEFAQQDKVDDGL